MIYNNRDLTKKRGGGGEKESKRGRKKEEGREALGRREELGTHILRREVLSPWDVGSSDPVFLAPIGLSRLLPNQPSPYQSPTFEPTLYKFVVTGLLGLDSIRRWAQSEKQDPTIGAVCGKGCSCDDECNGLLRQDQIP